MIGISVHMRDDDKLDDVGDGTRQPCRVGRNAPRLRTAQQVGLIAGSLVGVLSFVGPDAGVHFGLLLVAVVAAFVGWLDWRAGASRRQIIFTILLAVAAVFGSRVITFVILFQWAFG